MSILKKGGSSRFIIENFQDLDYVTIPAGFKLESVIIEKSGTTAGNITMGDYVSAVQEELSVIVTAAPTVSGNISVVLRGATAVLVPVLGTENIAQTVTKIASATYPGWTVEESLGTTVVWTAVVAEEKTGVTTVTGPTGFTRTGPNQDVAGADPTAGEQTVASVALSETDGALQSFTIVKSVYEEDTKIYLGVSSAATGNIAFQVQKLF